MRRDEMAGYHHQLSGHEFEWIPGWRRTREPGVLGSVRHDLVTKQQ